MRLEFLVYGNCQAPALAQILSNNSSFSKLYEVILQKPVHVLQNEDIVSTIENFKKADLVIYQHVKNSFHSLCYINFKTQKQ